MSISTLCRSVCSRGPVFRAAAYSTALNRVSSQVLSAKHNFTVSGPRFYNQAVQERPRPIVLLLGSGGRVGQVLERVMKGDEMDVIRASRELCAASRAEIEKFLRDNHISAVVNAAALSDGDPKLMRLVNVDLVDLFVKATQAESIPFVQLSTTATQLPGLGDDTRYAATKWEAEERVKKFCNGYIARLDVLVAGGSSDKLNIGHMARAGVSLHFKSKGDSEIFVQPTSYEAAATALSQCTLALIAKKPVPAAFNIAGDPILMSDFVSILDPSSFKVYGVPEKFLKTVTHVQNGCATPEFIYLLGKLENSIAVCNADYKRFLALGGKSLPTHSELAKEMRDQTNFLEDLKMAIEIFKKIEDKPAFFYELLNLVQSLDFSTAKHNSTLSSRVRI